jgi:hypothetical protein
LRSLYDVTPPHREALDGDKPQLPAHRDPGRNRLLPVGAPRERSITFSDVQLEVGNAADDVTTMLARAVWLVMPLEGGEADVEISLGLSGFAATGDRALGVLGWRLGGCDGEVKFPPGTDGEFVEKITYTATDTEAEVHLALWVTVERDGSDAGASLLTLTAIDGNIPI